MSLVLLLLLTVSWDQSPDTNVCGYLVRVAQAPYTTPEVTYWTTNTSCQVTQTWRRSWVCVQSFTACAQSPFCATNYIPLRLPAKTNLVVTVTGAAWFSESPLGPWQPCFEDPWIRTNPPEACMFFNGVQPSITATNY